jgi:hypothetical protein
MDFSTARLMVDFGLVILTWMVQLIVYPSFLYYDSKALILWHSKYTPSITKIVAPLMLAQLGLAIYGLFEELAFYSLTYAILVISMWGITFSIFIPLHEKIQSGSATSDLLKKLVRYNWIRTAVWTVLFLLSVARLFY